MNIFSIVVTHNGSKWIKKCVKSLMESTLESDIIIIDNNSEDETIEIVKKNFPEILNDF